MDTSVQPVAIKFDKQAQQLRIEWSDGFRSTYRSDFLRANCPSAGESAGREADNALAVLDKIPSGEIADLRTVGNYALQFTFADGHNAGIYTWDYLRRLADDPAVDTAALA